MRRDVIAWANENNVPLNVQPVAIEQLAHADAVFLTNSVIGIRIIERIEGVVDFNEHRSPLALTIDSDLRAAGRIP